MGSTSKLAIVIDASDLPVQFNSSFKPSGRPQDATHNHKKKGRLFASAESAAGAQEKAERKVTGTYERKKSGHRAKVHGQPEIKITDPVYHPFLCEWKGCKAELHNLETLQSHVKIVHRKRNMANMLECKWARCGERSDGQAIQFEDKHEWAHHVADVHITPVAWTMGDGPQDTDLCMFTKPLFLSCMLTKP